MRKQLFKACTALALTACLCSPLAYVQASELEQPELQEEYDILNGDSAGDYDEIVPSEIEQLRTALLTREAASSEEYRNRILEKMQEINKVEPRVTYESKSVKVPYHEQETGYWCGPATTQQTLDCINGKAPSQTTIAKALGTTKDGTDGHNIPPYLNEKQSIVRYVVASKLSLADFKKRLNTDISVHKVPVVARTKFKKGGSWLYSTNGHFMSISGFTKDMKSIKVTDPNITRVKKTATGTYSVSQTEMLNAINDHPKQEIYW